VEHKAIAVEVAEIVLDYVLAGHVKVDGRLPSERELAQELGVGRSAVREALKSLSFLGVIEVRPGGGHYLRGVHSALLPQVIKWGLLLGKKSTVDLLETRAVLEVAVARAAAERCDEQGMADLRRAMDGVTANLDAPAELAEADLTLHRRLAELAGNDVMLEILSTIYGLLRAWILKIIVAEKDSVTFREEHLAVVKAVEQGNGEAAASAMARHMAAANERLRQVVASEE
jgi:GntR family transcriptional repressor for pyruvate dehydrogenase complex